MPPATAASITSLTLVPYVRLTIRRSSSGRSAHARRRSGDSERLSALAGALCRSEWLSARVTRTALSVVSRSARAGEPATTSGVRSRPSCQLSRSRTPLARSCSEPGLRPGRQPSGSHTEGSGVGSSSNEPSSTAASPSTMQ